MGAMDIPYFMQKGVTMGPQIMDKIDLRQKEATTEL
jgi:hypothetical protein